MKRTKNKQKNNNVFRIVLAAILLVAVIALGVFSINSSKTAPIKYDEKLLGTWEYEDGSVYTFDKKGFGSFEYNGESFSYSYKVDAGTLILLFDDVEITDATYKYEVKDSELTLIGEEGTVGGTYTLNKIK